MSGGTWKQGQKINLKIVAYVKMPKSLQILSIGLFYWYCIYWERNRNIRLVPHEINIEMDMARDRDYERNYANPITNERTNSNKTKKEIGGEKKCERDEIKSMKYWFWWANKFIITSHESGIYFPTTLSYISRNNEWRKGAKSVTETFSSCSFLLLLLVYFLRIFLLLLLFLFFLAAPYLLSLYQCSPILWR